MFFRFIILYELLLSNLAICAHDFQYKAYNYAEKPLSTTDEKYFYKSYTGTIGNIPVTVNLVKQDTIITGFYYYDKIGFPISLYGSYKTGKNFKLKGSAYQSLAEWGGETFSCTFVSNTISGTWSNGKKTLNFNWVENTTDALTLKCYGQSAKYKSEDGAYFERIVLLPPPTDPLYKLLFACQFGTQTPISTDPQAILLAESKAYFENYDKEMDDLVNSGITTYRHFSLKTFVLVNTPELLCLQTDMYSFEGGAHGSGGSGFIIIDRKNARELKPTAIFKPNSTEALDNIVNQAAHEYYKVPPDEPLTEAADGCLSVASVKATDNIAIVPAGIIFFYNPYEIACYAAGPQHLFVPFAKIKGLLAPGTVVAKMAGI